jgi:AraC-like DNA-binding protein
MEIISYICLAQVVFSIFFLLTRRTRNTANVILVIWLILLTFPSVGYLLRTNGIEASYINRIISPAFVILYGPLLLLYTKALTKPKSILRYRTFLHLIPFILFFTLFATSNHNIVPPGMKENITNSHTTSDITDTNHTFTIKQRLSPASLDSDKNTNPLLEHYGLINLLIFIIYSAIVYRELWLHRKKIVHHFSNTSDRISLKWISLVTAYFIVSFMAIPIVETTFSVLSMKPPMCLHILVYMLFIYVLSFFGFKQAGIYSENEHKEAVELIKDNNLAQYYPPKIEPIKPDNQDSKDKQKYSHSGLKDDIADLYLSKLEAYMEKEKPFIECDLTISELSNKLNISRHHLTQVINNKLNKNFYQFINEYRVNEAIRKMSEPRNNKYTLITIAYDCGFNSKSGFNSIFKRITGSTPSQFKKKLVEKDVHP